MKNCRLRNGSIVPFNIVVASIMNLRLLASKDIMVLSDIGKVAHDPDYKPFNADIELSLKILHLLEADGTMSGLVRDVIQSSVDFQNGFPVLSNPIVEVLGDS